MPQYRTAFFSELSDLLEAKGITLDIFYGDTPPEWAARNDSAAGVIGMKLHTKFVTVGGRSLVYKDARPIISRGPYDGLIVEQAVRNLETYKLLFRGRRLAARYAYWGHGRTYTESRSYLEEKFKLEMSKRADWFFGYTDAGVEHLVANGYPRNQTTVVHNSIDSRRLVDAIKKLQSPEISHFNAKYDLQGYTALYIGGLDAAKRLDLLIAAADHAYSREPRFRLLVIGAGNQAEWLGEKAKSRSWVHPLGTSVGDTKFLGFAAAQVLAIPGRVGLVAVDSLAAGVPIVTTNWPFHAPEFEYLTPGHTCVVASDSAEEYGNALLSVITDHGELGRMSRQCLAQAPNHTIEKMASNFATGVCSMLHGL